MILAKPYHDQIKENDIGRPFRTCNKKFTQKLGHKTWRDETS